MHRRWLVLVLIRLVWVLCPQTGYIHPDEFFQTAEIVAGEVYGVDHERTWEYQQQVRSIVPPYIMAGLPMYIHHRLCEIYPSLRSAYLVLVLPRLTMIMSSLAVDYVVYCLSQDYGLDTGLALLMSGTSYLSLVYNTRTLTNALETSIFCLLLLWTLRLKHMQKVKNYLTSMLFFPSKKIKTLSGSVDVQGEEGNPSDHPRDFNKEDSLGIETNFDMTNPEKTIGHEKTKDHQGKYIEFHEKITDSAKFRDDFNNHEKLKDLPDDEDKGTAEPLDQSTEDIPEFQQYKVSLKEVAYLSAIGMVCVSGFFNRPTFIAFAAMPLLCWVVSFGKLPDTIQTKLAVAFFSVLTIMTILYVVADTFYYHFDDFKICLENKDNDYMYCTFILLYFSVGSSFSPYNFVEYNSNPLNLRQHGIHPRFLHVLVNLPLLFGPAFIFLVTSMLRCVKFAFMEGCSKLLDIGPDQRKNLSSLLMLFLIVPVFSLSLFPHQEPRFLIPVLPLVILISVQHISDISCKKRNLFLILWILFNAILALFYGVFHQGGVIPSLHFIQKEISSHKAFIIDHKSQVNLTTHDRFVYYHTFMPPKHLLLSKNSSDTLTDLRGSSPEKLYHEVNHLSVSDDSGFRNVYLVLPGTVIDGLELKYQTVYVFPYHLSVENLPSCENTLKHLREGQLLDAVSDLTKQTSLYIVRILSAEQG